MSPISFNVATATSMLCVYDLECLKHRLEDSADWWTIPNDEMQEVNQGNIAFIGLGADGTYHVSLVDSLPNFQAEVRIKAPSGRLFVGAGEEVSSDGLEPEGLRGGRFVSVAPGDYIVRIAKISNEVVIAIQPGGQGRNKLSSPLRLE